MVDESMQGGAINRVIDIESSGEKLFDNGLGNKVVKTIEESYGWAGEEYIFQLTEMGFDEINNLYSKNYDLVRETAKKKGVEKEDKQIAPMALMLTADEISEKYLFMDGVRIDIDQAIDYLRNKGEISEMANTYERILDQIMINEQHFSNGPEYVIDNPAVGQWGCYLDDDKRIIAILPEKFKELIGGSGSLDKTFKSWAKKQGIIQCDNGKNQKNVRYLKRVRKMIVMDTWWTKDGNLINPMFGEDEDKDLPFK